MVSRLTHLYAALRAVLTFRSISRKIFHLPAGTTVRCSVLPALEMSRSTSYRLVCGILRVFLRPHLTSEDFPTLSLTTTIASSFRRVYAELLIQYVEYASLRTSWICSIHPAPRITFITWISDDDSRLQSKLFRLFLIVSGAFLTLMNLFRLRLVFLIA